jgi:hypothetical protein
MTLYGSIKKEFFKLAASGCIVTKIVSYSKQKIFNISRSNQHKYQDSNNRHF